MGILDSLQSMLGEAAGSGAAANPGAASQGGMGGLGGLGSLAGMLGSGGLGDIARNILTDKKGDFSWLKGALVAGAGSMLWKKLASRVSESNTVHNPHYGLTQSNPQDQAIRAVKALVFAAKADGHIDANENAAISQKISAMNLGPQGKTLIQQAMDAPLDPQAIADGVNDPQEALALYAMSRSVIDPDQYMEKSYLDGLAEALNIPDDVREHIEQQIGQARSQPVGY